MKTLLAMLAAATLFGGSQTLHGGDREIRSAQPKTETGAYRLIANGGEAACTVKRGAAVSDTLSELAVDGDCRALLPDIERAKFWRDRADGTVGFSENGTDPLVAFAVADGDGLESYAPVSPLLSLAAE